MGNIMAQTLVIDKDSKAWKDGFAAGLRDGSALEAARTLNAQEFGNWLDGYSAAFDKLIGDLKIEVK
jgi:hypothetical protein